MGLLQQRIEEVGSAIINHKDNLVHITTFYNSDRLNDYLGGLNCIQGFGMYDPEDLDYTRIQDNCLMIVQKDDKEVHRFQFKPLFRGTVKVSNSGKKAMARIFTLRKCLFSSQYNVMILDENNEKQNLLFKDMDEIESTFYKMFPNHKLYNLDNKIIQEGFDYVKRHDID